MKRLSLILVALAAFLLVVRPSNPILGTGSAGATLPKVLLAQVKDHGGLHVEGGGVKEVILVSKFPFQVKAPKGADLYLWKYPIGWTVKDTSTDTLVIKDAAKGEQMISVLVWKVDWEAKRTVKESLAVTVQVGDISPTPPGPEPPGPKPPPGPVTGLRVIFITETADESKYPAGQIAAMFSEKVRQYLDAKCKGGKEGWRRFDKDTEASKLPDPWNKAWEAVKPQIGKLPQVAIITDQSGELFPVPNSADELLALLKKYGG